MNHRAPHQSRALAHRMPACLRRLVYAACACTLGSTTAPATHAAEPTRNQTPAPRPLVLVHYMTWFAAKPVAPGWGWHWTMNAYNPDQFQNGQRSLASHYHPLIGPYDSSDPDVVEYHFLLMKLAGIDGIVVDWYGRSRLFDYPLIHANTAALFPLAAKIGLRIAVCYEDQTIPRLVEAGLVARDARTSHGRETLAWLQQNWFREPAYLRLEGRPLLLSFGSSGLTDDEWTAILPRGKNAPIYLSEHRKRAAADGAFDWPVPPEGLARLERFAADSQAWRLCMPAAFPRFHDIYAQAKVHASYGQIADDDGKTYESTLSRALKSGAPCIQIVTWNDWGEGTIIEPSVEFGYRDLAATQRLVRKWIDPAFGARAEDLRLAFVLHSLRRQSKARAGQARLLDQARDDLAAGRTHQARAILDKLQKPGQ